MMREIMNELGGCNSSDSSDSSDSECEMNKRGGAEKKKIYEEFFEGKKDVKKKQLPKGLKEFNSLLSEVKNKYPKLSHRDAQQKTKLILSKEKPKKLEMPKVKKEYNACKIIDKIDRYKTACNNVKLDNRQIKRIDNRIEKLKNKKDELASSLNNNKLQCKKKDKYKKRLVAITNACNDEKIVKSLITDITLETKNNKPPRVKKSKQEISEKIKSMQDKKEFQLNMVQSDLKEKMSEGTLSKKQANDIYNELQKLKPTQGVIKKYIDIKKIILPNEQQVVYEEDYINDNELKKKEATNIINDIKDDLKEQVIKGEITKTEASEVLKEIKKPIIKTKPKRQFVIDTSKRLTGEGMVKKYKQLMKGMGYY